MERYIKILLLLVQLVELKHVGYSQDRTGNLAEMNGQSERLFSMGLEKYPVRLMNAGRSTTEKQYLQQSYWLMIGILEDLSLYRDQYIRSGSLINIFPTAYFHTTFSEVRKIAAGHFTFPIEKMRQMAAFYDAYKWNRDHWDNGNKSLVENHWKLHFEYAESNSVCLYAPYVLTTGIAAHVEVDLARAIRFAYDNRFDKSIDKKNHELLTDFMATNTIFKLTRTKTLDDIGEARPFCAEALLGWFGEMFDGVLIKANNVAYEKVTLAMSAFNLKSIRNDKDVINLRMAAWDLAYSDQQLPKYFGWNVLGQPILDHTLLQARGKMLCRLAKVYKNPSDLIRIDSIILAGNSPEVTKSHIKIRKNDFVYIEVAKNVKVGETLGFSDGTGLLEYNPVASQYNKYKNYKHGAVMIFANGKMQSCKKLLIELGMKYFPFVSLTNGKKYVPGYYFIAEEDAILQFDINDAYPANNTGQFTVGVITLSYDAHFNRNLFNNCPSKDPSFKSDCAGGSWENEGVKSAFYHGVGNEAYRGSGNSKGCQCVYDDGDLLTEGDNAGSFDIGYWMVNGNLKDPRASYYHLVLDVIPHDLFKDWSAINPEYKTTGISKCR